MNILKASTAAIALTVAGTVAFAESHVTADDAMENDAAQVEQSVEGTAEATGNAVETGVEETGAAIAETADASDDMQNFDLTTSENLIRSRDIVGGEVWRMDAEADNSTWSENGTYEGTGDGWERIGSIEDIVLSKDGKMIGIVGEVGGFLGLGDKMVLMPVENVRLTAIDDGQYAFVTQMTQEDIEAAQDVDEGFWD
ncbi:PRC-barrel domain-containing protein [Loktanella salsilacus]|uniref:PRC-barrel domain-containing protein n=1 Tax=Loktanella salsilacus TaxID=195913 RepID=UPI0037370DC7